MMASIGAAVAALAVPFSRVLAKSPSHTTVNASHQTGYQIIANDVPADWRRGDVIEIANVYAINRLTKKAVGALRQFVLISDPHRWPDGNGMLAIYPHITPWGEHQTVAAAPMNRAIVRRVSAAAI